jgi:hypothetical protein
MKSISAIHQAQALLELYRSVKPYPKQALDEWFFQNC